jgi:hypothetical protein
VCTNYGDIHPALVGSSSIHPFVDDFPFDFVHEVDCHDLDCDGFCCR